MTSPVISPEALRDALGSVLLLDARTGPNARRDYEEAHLPGARYVDLETDLAARGDARIGGRHPLPSPSAFAETLGMLGVRPEDDVVVYDLAAGASAASRAWWMLRAFGHARVRVLEGTPAEFERAGLAMTATPSQWEPCARYAANAYQLPTMGIDAVASACSRTSACVIDARSAARFRGEVEPIDPIAGHIPGATNLFHMDLVDERGRMRPADEIARKFREVAGDVAMEHVVVHCGSGVTACHAMLAFEYAGLGLPALYVGSWSEWCRSGRPMQTSAYAPASAAASPAKDGAQ